MKNFDAIIIGSGQAGTPLAFKLAGMKQKVAFIEKEHLGGTCLNTGCTPTKAYVASARRMWDACHGEDLGVEIPKGAVANLQKIKARKDALIKKSVDGIKSGVESNDYITWFNGLGKFVDNHTVLVNGEHLRADKIFINVGSRALIPNNFKEANPMSNQEILELEEIPEHLIIVGGSYIGLEFGQMFKRFGSEVTIIEKTDRIVSREDQDVSEALQEIMEKEGIRFRLKADCLTASRFSDGGVKVKVDCEEAPSEISGSHLLMAVGRVPNTDALGLEHTSIEVDNKGFIKVDDTLETTVKGVYALGDCNGKGAFTHTAYNDFEIIAANLYDKGNRKVSDRILTYSLFVDPPLARVGITLQEAKKRGLSVKVGYREMKKVARAKEKGETNGFMRVIIDAESDKILGASILGVGGDEAIGSLINIMYADVLYTVFRDSVQPHPTLIELIPTLLEDLNISKD